MQSLRQEHLENALQAMIRYGVEGRPISFESSGDGTNEVQIHFRLADYAAYDGILTALMAEEAARHTDGVSP